MIAFLAAALPIVGALFAATSYLAEHRAIEREYRVRRRLAPMMEERYWRLRPEMEARAERMGHVFDPDLLFAEQQRFEEMMLGLHGLKPPPRFRHLDLNLSMSAPRVPRREIVRQWVLIVSSTVGVILLALDSAGGGAASES